MNLHNDFEKHVAIWHARTHYPYQDRITKAILDGVEASKRGEVVEIPIEVPRQSGKTTSIVDVSEFLLCTHRAYFKKPVAVGIFAPQREQATTDFDRLKIQYTEISDLGFTTKANIDVDTKMPEKWNSKTIRLYNGGKFCGEAYIFPISKTSNPESKTLDVIIIEEAQQVDDKKMQHAVFPMGAATNAVRILIGTAGTRLCYFKKQLDTNPRAIRISLDQVFKDRRSVYEQTNDSTHLRYQQFVEHEINENGRDSDYIKTQYLSTWVIGTGQFCTADQLDAIEDDEFVIPEKSDRPCYVGIDTAKSPDQTVVTVIADDEKDEMKSDLVGWLSMRGENYEDQFEIMDDWLKNFSDIRIVSLDATGQGDFMPDKFERHTAYNLNRVPFSQSSKDVLYKQLLQVIQNKMTRIPKDPKSKDYITWRSEMLNLEKEYKGRFLSVHHPDDPNAHDDYTDSWALAEYGKSECIRKEPRLTIL